MSAPPSPPTRVARLRALFDAALEMDAGEREHYLSRTCGHDPTLRADVESLLRALERSAATWDGPVGAAVAEAVADAADSAMVGRRIGPYEVVRLVGYGGMGAVYEGVRADDQYRKRVALKFLRRGMEGDLAVRRFRYERQILANLDHENIAALYDGGVTADGQPYFVMEYVDGEPITAYCARRALGVRARVQLLRQVCAAVQHAHRNLVVHRDLKPGNILVTGDGTVKLLDFGIAKLLREPEGVGQLPMTQGGLAFTPDYASPEQVRGVPVATASDVYSLGVICCEVLTGHRPFRLEGKLLREMQDAVCLAPPPLPSSLVTDADARQFGERRASAVRARLAGDLDAIVLQALRKEPDRRYGSAEQLSDDLRRHLDRQPVTARPDRLGYRVRKLVQRRRVEAAAGVLVAAALAGGAASTAHEARRAEQERARAEQVSGLLRAVLAALEPGTSGWESRRLDPEVEARLRHAVGQTFHALGRRDCDTTAEPALPAVSPTAALLRVSTVSPTSLAPH